MRETWNKTIGYRAHLLKWPKSKPLTTPNADKDDAEQQELAVIAGGNAK